MWLYYFFKVIFCHMLCENRGAFLLDGVQYPLPCPSDKNRIITNIFMEN